jgi:hypothetical protein
METNCCWCQVFSFTCKHYRDPKSALQSFRFVYLLTVELTPPSVSGTVRRRTAGRLVNAQQGNVGKDTTEA